MRYPLFNRFLQNDLQGNGKVIGPPGQELGGLSVGYKTTKEVWIGIRTGNKVGSGSEVDPFHVGPGTTIESVLEPYVETPNIKLILLAHDGEYEVQGSDHLTLPVQTTIVGTSRAGTIFKLKENMPGSPCVFSSDPDVNGNGIRIESCTLDGNFDQMDTPPLQINGAVLYGDHNVLHNVRITNLNGTFASLHESFAALLQGCTGSIKGIGNRIEGCQADDPHGDYAKGFVVCGYGGGPSLGGYIGGGNVVLGYVPASATDSHMAAYGIGGGVLCDSYASNCQIGVYCEQGEDIIIRNLTLKAIWEQGISVTPVTDITGLLISGNRIEMRDDNEFRRWCINLALAGANRVREVIVSNNVGTLLVTGNTPGDPSGSIGIVANFEHLAVNLGHSYLGNHFDAVFSHRPADGALIDGNRDLEDGLITALPDNRGVFLSFTPTTVGWYKILTGLNSFGGRLEVLAEYGSGALSDLEFEYDAFGYGAFDGTIQQLRVVTTDNPIVTKVRLSNNGGDTVQLELYVAYVTDAEPISIYGYGPKMGTFFAAPVTGSTSLGTNVVEFTFSKGFDSSYGTIFDAPAVFVDKGSGKDSTGARMIKSLPFASIQAALTAAVDGDEIIIAPGTYDEEVTVKAGTYVITLQHGAIWKQTADAACLKSANVTCDFTINGDLYTEDDGATAIAERHPNCIIRMNGKVYATGTGTAYTNPSAVLHEDGTLYINDDIIIGAVQIGISAIATTATAHLIVTGSEIAAQNHNAVFVRGAGTAVFVDCKLSSTLTQTVGSVGRSMEFTRCTIACTGHDAFSGSGTVIVTLHEYNHLISSSGSSELSSGLSQITLDGISFTNKPKEAGTALSGDGYLFEGGAAQTGTVALT